MPKLSLLRSDLQLEEEGQWEKYKIPGCEVDMEFKIARLGNRLHTEEVQRLMQEYFDNNPTEAVPGQRIPDDVQEDLQAKAAAKFVLLDWRNVEDDDGEPMEYTHEAGYNLLMNKEFHDLQSWFTLVAGNKERYRRKADIDAAGNSVGSSSGTTNGDHT
jgi:hypothetical protein